MTTATTETNGYANGNGTVLKEGKLALRGSMSSWCTLRVLVMLYERGIQNFELIPVDFRKFEHKSPEHLALQPFGKVPVLHDGDFTLYESRAICKYIELKFGPKGGEGSLMPTVEKDGLQTWALFEQALNAEAFNFDDLAGRLVHEIWLVPLITGKPLNEEAVATYRRELSAKMDVLDVNLQRYPYFFGEKFTLVDLFYMPLVNSLFDVNQGDLITERAGWKAWWERVNERPAWKRGADEYAVAMGKKK